MPSIIPALRSYIEALPAQLATGEPATIPAARRDTLDRLARFMHERRAAGQSVQLVFICTHNSRRSHMSQLWAAVAAAWYGIDGVETYSGGTEATAFNPRAVAAMVRAGFTIRTSETGTTTEAGDDNPHYQVVYAADRPPLLAYSKTYDDPNNPREGFAAIMNCSEADDACPFVPGAALRISLAYDDPKQADGSPEAAARYDERARQIATEMLYAFARLDSYPAS